MKEVVDIKFLIKITKFNQKFWEDGEEILQMIFPQQKLLEYYSRG